jgi:predicted Zn-dependent protease
VTYIDLSEALSRNGRAAEAVAALERGRAAFPYSKVIRKHLTLAYITQKAYPNAKLTLEDYVRDFPEDEFMRGLLSQARAGPQR